MRKPLILAVLLAFISTSIVVAAIVSAKYSHPAHRTNEAVSPRATPSEQTFGAYSQLIKDGWDRKEYSSIVIFGASDCDDAHPRSQMYAQTLRGAPFWHGRYTNGPVFGEYLAASTLIGHNITSLNYAYGRATISNELVNVVAPDLKEQIGMYLDDVTNGKAQRGNEQNGRVLHCIWLGKNDIIDIWNNVISNQTFQNGNSNGEKSGFEYAMKRVHLETTELLNQLKSLRSNSKVNSIKSDYVVMLLQPLEIVPNLFYQSKSLAKNDMTLANKYLKYIGDLAQSFNKDLIEGITLLSQDGGQTPNVHSLSTQNTMVMDIPKYWYYLRSHPEQYNFVNTVDACWNSTTGVDCKEPTRWQYYDTLHVTTKMHEYLAQEITVQVNS